MIFRIFFELLLLFISCAMHMLELNLTRKQYVCRFANVRNIRWKIAKKDKGTTAKKTMSFSVSTPYSTTVVAGYF